MTPDDVRGGYPAGGHHPGDDTLPADLTAVQADDALIDALRLIDRSGCETFTSGRCLDPGSGLVRGAEYGADAWCAPCVAADALTQALLAWRHEVDTEPVTQLVDTDTAQAVLARARRPDRRHRFLAALRRVWRGRRR